jgi:hypothetical protein
MPQLPDRHPDPSPATVARGHEQDPLPVRATVWLVVAFIGFAAVAHAGIWFVLKHEVRQPRAVDRPRSVVRPDPGPPAGAPALQPTPRHDETPWEDVAGMHEAEDGVFDAMGWTVEDGRARIPDAVVRAVAARAATRAAPPTANGGGK